MKEVNCITIYDVSDEAVILYSSESVVDVTGYTQEELRGKTGYCLIDPEIVCAMQAAGTRVREEDNMATVMYTSIKHKTEGLIPIESVSGRCFDIIVAVITRADKGQPRLRACYATSQHTYTRKNGGIMATQDITPKYATSIIKTPPSPEPAACMILNRFTRHLTIEFATKNCEFLLGIDARKCNGLSFLSYIDPDDLLFVTEQFENVKVSNAVAQLQFSFLSPQYRQSLPVRAAIFCANDGIILNIRLFKHEKSSNDGLVFLNFFLDGRPDLPAK
ncbi:hypothetical protein K493DRAFT_5613 [Basidiobolus meristosporus CBS 931.73]|uniref:PAS domain-containing protein n=1 Tax=Basidiobolus meristosporus CBS 931.73 TaxID=1314790 RepID=A0A1Y1YKX5_9FUNG|nr:hypothetical protein K493DRAFT_5613 [Basidiobolus meristosporus CBS 931.73]|eukprot:ORX98632.1 hypothetical protein K493DRAFT_5613 [Basidiobolus meristosporus CBS 931.73]